MMSKTVMRCKCCKLELTESLLFQKNQIWTELQELFKDKGIDDEDIQDIENQTKGTCFNCGPENANKLAMAYTIARFLEEPVFDDAYMFCNLALHYREQATLVKAFNVVEETILEQKLDVVKAHSILIALFRLGQNDGKSRHVNDTEKEMMQTLKNHGLSNQDISSIFGRSKETVHRLLKEVQT